MSATRPSLRGGVGESGGSDLGGVSDVEIAVIDVNINPKEPTNNDSCSC